MGVEGTVLAGLVGGAVASVINGVVNFLVEGKRHAATFMMEEAKRREDRRKDDVRFRRDRLIDPIIAFVDELLACISQYYWNAADSAERAGKMPEEPEAQLRLLKEVGEQLRVLRCREGGVEARVRALDQPELTAIFRELSMQIWLVRKVDGLAAAREEAQEASRLGAALLALLCKVEERQLSV